MNNPPKNILYFKLIVVFFSFYLFLSCGQENLNKVRSAKSVLKITEKVADWHIKQKQIALKTNREAPIAGNLNALHWTNGML